MRVVPALAAAVLAVSAGSVVPASAHSSDGGYDLPVEGVTIEGIGYDEHSDVIYVSGVNDGGTIYKADVGEEELEVWQPPNRDGRSTARGIDVDDFGRVYVAGGPTARAFVYAEDGTRLTALDAPSGTVLNDVWVGKDGVAYITDSSAPRIFRLHQHDGVSWELTLWLDATGIVPADTGPNVFNWNGIVETRDGKYLLIPQTSTGKLWRVEKATKAVTDVDLGEGSIPSADGVVLKGHTLYAIQNFARKITEVRLSGDFSTGVIGDVLTTPADRTFTTAKLVRGDLLAVDSQFGQPQPWEAADRVVPLPRP